MDEEQLELGLAASSTNGNGKVRPPANSSTPKPTDLDKELGIGTSLPMSSWESFLGGENLVLRTGQIPIDDLVEMRKKDGQIRALVRLLTLPILKALETAEWVEADTDNSNPDPEHPAELPPSDSPQDKTPVKPPPGAKTEQQPAKPQGPPAKPGSKVQFAAPPPPAGPPAPPAGKGAAPPGPVPPTGPAPTPPPAPQSPPAPPLPKKVAPPEVEFANLMWTLPPYEGGMTVTAKRVMRQVLLALVEGFAVFEEVRYIPEDGPLKGKIVLKKLAYRDSRTVKFRVDDKGGFDGIRQKTTFAGKTIDVVIPQDKSWYWACNEEENPYYGVSYFEAAFHHWQNKRRLYYIAHIAAQFAAVPGRVGTVPRSATAAELAAFRKALKDFAFNTSLAKPENFEVEFANQNTSFNFLDLINHHNSEMAKSVLAKFLNDENRTVLIDKGNADASTDFFVMQLEALMDEIAESITHYVMPKYIDWNFGTEVYPVLKFPPINDGTKDVIKDMLVAVATATQSQITPEFILEMEKKMADRLGLDVDYEEVAKRKEEEAAKAEEQRKAQLQAFAPPTDQFGGQQGPPGGPGDNGPPGAGGPPGGGGGGQFGFSAEDTGLLSVMQDLVAAIQELPDAEE